MKFSDKLKQLRMDRNMTQDELASQIYVSRSAISKWETGAGYPSIDSLKQLSKLFNISVDELISDEELRTKVYSDEKRRRQFYWVAIFFFALAVAFSVFTFTTKNKLFSIGAIIGVLGYITFAILQKPAEKRLNLKNADITRIFSYLIVAAVTIVVIVSTIIM